MLYPVAAGRLKHGVVMEQLFSSLDPTYTSEVTFNNTPRILVHLSVRSTDSTTNKGTQHTRGEVHVQPTVQLYYTCPRLTLTQVHSESKIPTAIIKRTIGKLKSISTTKHAFQPLA